MGAIVILSLRKQVARDRDRTARQEAVNRARDLRERAVGLALVWELETLRAQDA